MLATEALLSSPQAPDEGLAASLEPLKPLVEITIFAVLFYAVLRFLWATRGSTLLKGLLVVLVAVLVAAFLLIRTFALDRVAWLAEQLGPSVALGLVVVFHPEIRRAIVHLGDAKMFRTLFRSDTKVVPRLLRAISRLSEDKTGALIAIEREASLSELSENGHLLDAELNSYLLESIFFPKSPLHDGGVVVRDDRIVAASCLFPLSQNTDVDKRLGTRHRAALGLSEETDAFVLVVSEETGSVSTASGGKLDHGLTLAQLEAQLNELYGNKKSKASS
ncbi:MAG: diadenylate cyclase CdaA [Planctomycetota bacterium]|jgi:diadenylate cyclase